MDKKVIDNIVWWIPFKKLRNKFREYLLDNHYIELEVLNLRIKKLYFKSYTILQILH